MSRGRAQTHKECASVSKCSCFVATTRNARRRAWRKVHLYLGLFIGFLFAFSGLTGSALVFYQAIDESLNPALLTVEPGVEYAPLTEITAAAQRVVSAEAKPARFYLPRHAQAAMKVRFSVSRAGQDILLDVMVNPFTAEVLGQRQWGGYLMSFLYKLHYTLVLGDAGETIVGVMGLLLMGSLLSGVVLWWPKRTKFFQAFTFRRSANRTRFIYDLHKTIGFYASVVLVVMAFSGVSMIFPHYVKLFVNRVSPLTVTAPAQLSVSAEAGGKRLDLDKISTIAKNQFPQAALQRIYFPASADSVYRVILRQSDEARKTSGSTRLWINPYNGKILAIQQPQTQSGGDTFLNWMFPLHNGEAFGLAGRIIVFISGFVLVGLYVTGLIVWWRKRQARKRCDRRHLENAPLMKKPRL